MGSSHLASGFRFDGLGFPVWGSLYTDSSVLGSRLRCFLLVMETT